MDLSKKLEDYITGIRKNIKAGIPCNGIFVSIRHDQWIIKEIIQNTQFLSQSYDIIEMSQRIWHISNNEYSILKCTCGLPKIFFRFSSGYHSTCGNTECKKNNKIKNFNKTNNDRYGGHYFQKDSESRKKYDETMLRKYGVKHNFSGNMRSLSEKTMSEKYGVKYPLQSPEIKEKEKRPA